MSRFFIITIDTEGDNLWNYIKGDVVKTENTLYIPRFQELCERYAFKPVYLTNYEMLNDSRYVNYIKPKADEQKCEIGIHIHAWNNPPLYQLEKKYDGNPFLIEYPLDVMREKFKITYNLFVEKFKTNPVSHRAGRWIMDERYFTLLEEFNVNVDCSYTPFISWANTQGETQNGCDYTDVNYKAHYKGNVLEVPMTIRRRRLLSTGPMRRRMKALLKTEAVWLRPATTCIQDMLKLCKSVSKEKDNAYLEFMLHSSELMPGGSPYFVTKEDVEVLYSNLERLFDYVGSLGYRGATLCEFRNRIAL